MKWDKWGIIYYLVLFLFLMVVISLACRLIPVLEAAPEPITVFPVLRDPMPEVERLQEVAYRLPDVADVGLVVRTAICECGTKEPLGCYDAIVQTIRTRATQRGQTYGEVVLDPWQYSCWNPDIPASLQRLRDSPEEALPVGYYSIIKDIVMNALSGAESPYAGIDHYYSHCLISPPFWAYKFEFVGQEGCHKFYKELRE